MPIFVDMSKSFNDHFKNLYKDFGKWCNFLNFLESLYKCREATAYLGYHFGEKKRILFTKKLRDKIFLKPQVRGGKDKSCHCIINEWASRKKQRISK